MEDLLFDIGSILVGMLIIVFSKSMHKNILKLLSIKDNRRKPLNANWLVGWGFVLIVFGLPRIVTS